MQIADSDESEIDFARVTEGLCGRWMPRKKATWARRPGHAPPCMTTENMASRRVYRRNHPHLESPESKKKSNRKYRISSAKVLAARLYGVGPVTALAMTCWLGGAGRFSSSRKAVRFAGLAGEGGLAGLPGLAVAGLSGPDARALLASVIPGRLDERVRDRTIAESG